jgi:hypothetical protein
MKELIFSGVVHPERAQVSIPETTQYLDDLDGNNIGKFTIAISVSQITAHLSTTKEDIDLFTWRNSLQPRIEVLVDSYGFLVGCGYEIEIIKAYDVQAKKDHIFGVNIETLPTCESKEELLRRYLLLLSLSKGMEGGYIQRCLADLRQAIRNPFDSSLYCFRAVESIRQIYCYRQNIDPEKQRSKSWQILREDLDLDESLIQNNIQKYAKVIRHGGLSQFTQEERTQMLGTTWNIVHKYIDKYGKNNF